MPQLLVVVVACLVVVGLATAHRHKSDRAKLNHMEKNLEIVARQMMMQQFYVEEQARSSGNSGLKRVRILTQGTRPYHSSSHTDRNMVAAIHNHPNQARMLGFGEMVAVLNGIEFRTRHNDYRIRSRHSTRTKHGWLEDVPFPGIPPAVTKLTDLDEQIAEMREWFKAWRDQDYSVRDYRPYFKPVLCYLEGKWTHSKQSSIDEPFESSRHHLDATSWLDLTDKVLTF
jgi:hypothetical protein